jgi:hypothetical protein
MSTVTNSSYKTNEIQPLLSTAAAGTSLMALIQSVKGATAVASDANSLFRNIFTAAKISPNAMGLTGSAAQIASGSTAVAGGMGLFIATVMVYNGIENLRKAAKEGDKLAMAAESFYIASGATFGGLSGVFGAGGIMSLQGIAVPAAMGAATTGLGLAMYGSIAVSSTIGLVACQRFSDKLNGFFKSGKMKGIDQAFEHIYNYITDKGKENSFKFRTSESCFEDLTKIVEGRSIEKFSLEEKITVINKVVEANYKKKVMHVLLILVSLLGIATFIASMLLAGPVSPILFAVGAALWLVIDSSTIQSAVADKFWKWHGSSGAVSLDVATIFSYQLEKDAPAKGSLKEHEHAS